MDCFFDKESITWDANRVVELENGLDECEVLVLVLSPDFCRSEWPRVESSNAIVDDPAGLRRKRMKVRINKYTQEIGFDLETYDYMND